MIATLVGVLLILADARGLLREPGVAAADYAALAAHEALFPRGMVALDRHSAG